ncbi:MAG: ABC transporter ATP-binding protein [Gaiellales bacterium]
MQVARIRAERDAKSEESWLSTERAVDSLVDEGGPMEAASAQADPVRARHGSSSSVVLRAESLTKRYGATLALDRLDLSLEAGEVYGYLGPNGAGKTTTIRLLLGLHRPTAGRAELFGIDAWRDPVAAHRRLAYVAGEPLLWPGLTGEECLAFLANLHGSVDEAYRRVLVERFEFDPRKRVRDYSKGNRQKIQLIAAFSARPELLMLDEPTSGLDPLMEAAFRETVSEAKAAGATVFLSSHILSEVEALCDRVGILRAGRLVEQGTLAELRHLSQHVVEATFAGAPPPIVAPAGVTIAPAGAASLHFAVKGPIGPLLDVLAGTGVVSLTSREPSLEELFLAQYDEEAGGGATPDA